MGLRRKDGAILVVRRAPGEKLSGYWEFPGGKVEPDETDQECLRRELEEELGIDVEVGDFIEESHYVYDHGEFLLRAFDVTQLTREIKLHVHDELAWLAPDQLTSMKLAPADIPIAKLLAKKD